MFKGTRILAILALLLVLSYATSSEHNHHHQKQIYPNEYYPKIHQAYIARMESQGGQAPFVANADQESYKRKIIEEIIYRGADQNQIDYYNKNLKGISPNFSFLQMTRAISAADNPASFMGSYSYTTDIHKIPTSGRVKVKPWSSTYWPTSNAGVSVRYPNSSKKTLGYKWRQSVSMYSQPSEYSRNYRSSNFNSQVASWYSPAEKWDLMCGDTAFTLTNYLKRDGAQYVKNGDVPNWYGICHGWAPASYLFDRPVQAFSMTGATGAKIQWLPDDIKGMASQFWANAKYTTRWIGARCDYASSDSRWSSNANCRSLNPAALYIAMGNYVGIYGKGCVIDPKADAEIWNQPVDGYNFGLYNLRTQQYSSNPDAIKMSVAKARTCGSNWCRQCIRNLPAGTTHVLGVLMQITYIVETTLTHTSSTRPDARKTGTFDSCIQLDGSGNIIGGEWRYNEYPNFMWRPDQDMDFSCINDASVPTFGGTSAELQNITQFCKSASSKGQLVKSVINWLVEQANGN